VATAAALGAVSSLASIGGMGVARYDGVAEWYRVFRPSMPPDELDVLERLLGRGQGRCLDVGCGTGLATEAVAELGWSAVGVDLSEDMLETARGRGLEVVHGSATELPFDDATFDAAVSSQTHIDIDDFAAAMSETARVLRPEAPLVYIGTHPCFMGPHSVFLAGRGVPELHPGYRQAGRYDESAPGVANPDGVRAKVGAVHLPLAAFLATFFDAGFRIERFEELGSRDYPHVVALRARR
jgi:SAM-dependent methyltransferase